MLLPVISEYSLLKNLKQCILNETHVHVNYLIIILLQTICTSAMCELHWGHPEHINIIPSHYAGYFHQTSSNDERLKSHLKASLPVTLINFWFIIFVAAF